MTMQARGNVLPVRMRGDLTPNAVTVARAPDAASWSVGPVHLFHEEHAPIEVQSGLYEVPPAGRFPVEDRARPGLTR